MAKQYMQARYRAGYGTIKLYVFEERTVLLPCKRKSLTSNVSYF